MLDYFSFFENSEELRYTLQRRNGLAEMETHLTISEIYFNDPYSAVTTWNEVLMVHEQEIKRIRKFALKPDCFHLIPYFCIQEPIR